jgi:hypothetical protein
MLYLELHSQLASLVQSTPWYRTMKLSRLYPARRIASELQGEYMISFERPGDAGLGLGPEV